MFLRAREEVETGRRLRACLINKPSGCLLAPPRVHPPAFGLLFSFTTQRERPSPSPEDGRKLTHQQDPSGLLDIWKDSQFFSCTPGASCSDFLLLLTLPVVFLLLPCLPLSYATSSHPEPSPILRSFKTPLARDFRTEQAYRKFGLKGGENAPQRGADRVSGPPRHCPCRCTFCLLQHGRALCF